METAGYLAGARQRFVEFGGFSPVDEEQLPPQVTHWAEFLLRREEPGLITLVAPVVATGEGPVHSLQAGLLTAARAVEASSHTDVLALLLIVTEAPLTRELYDQVQQLKVSERSVRLVPWVVDLTRSRLFPHSGPPFGVDPDLTTLAAPEASSVQRVEPPRRRTGPAGLLQALRNYPVTVSILAVNVAVWLVMTVTGGGLDATTDTSLLTSWGALTRPDLWQTGQFWRLLTAAFIHIGAVHLLVNSISLWSVGQLVESLFGSRRMLFVYLIAAVAGSSLSCVLGAPVVVSAGASGAIFGLLGAVIWFRLSSPLGRRIPWRPLLTTLALNLGIGIALHSFIDNWNHIGGLLGGTVAAFAIGVPFLPEQVRPKFQGPRSLHLAFSGVLVAAALALVLGLVELPGSGRVLAQAYSYYDQHQYAQAVPGLQQGARQAPDEPDIWLHLTVSYLNLNRCTDAKNALDQLVATAEHDPVMDRLAAELQRCKGP